MANTENTKKEFPRLQDMTCKQGSYLELCNSGQILKLNKAFH